MNVVELQGLWSVEVRRAVWPLSGSQPTPGERRHLLFTHPSFCSNTWSDTVDVSGPCAEGLEQQLTGLSEPMLLIH